MYGWQLMNNFVAGLIGGVIGVITWKLTPYSAEFGVGPLIYIFICFVGGIYTFGKN